MQAHWTENDVTVGGVQLHYYRTGAGDKPPLVLLHGFSDNGLCWLPVALELEAGWDVVMPDARGHGKSQRVQAGEEVDSAVDTAGLIQALGLNHPVVCGHSMGGNTAGLLAAQYPALVRGMILEDPGWRSAPPPQPSEGEKTPPSNPWMDWLVSIKGRPVEEVMAKCRADSPTWAEIELRPWAESKLQLDTNIFNTKNLRWEWQEVAARITCPTLLMTADADLGAIVTADTAQKATELSRVIRVARIPGVGHNLRRENFKEFMSLVKAFLGSLHSLG